MGSDKLSRIKVLCTFLKSNRNVFNSLRCLQVEVNNDEAAQNLLREQGMLDVIFSFAQDQSTKIRNAALYTLCSAISNNFDSKLRMTRHRLFDDIYSILSGAKLASGSQFVCLLLLSEICLQNPCAQEFSNISGCVEYLVILLGKLLRQLNTIVASSVHVTFFSLLCRSLSYCLDSPTNEANQHAILNHQVYKYVLKSLDVCSLTHSIVMESLSQLICATYHRNMNDCCCSIREKTTTAICYKIKSAITGDLTNVGNSKSLAALLKCLHQSISIQAVMSSVCQNELNSLVHPLVKVLSSLCDTKIRQLLLFLISLITDCPGFDYQMSAANSSYVRTLYQLTYCTDDPVVHCAVSYILLGLDGLSSKEYKLVRKVAPGSLVRMGLSLEKAQSLINGESVQTKTRKQLFEANDVMEFFSSDDDSDSDSLHQVNKEDKKPLAKNQSQANSTQWLQLTPPSRIKSISSSPGWRTRVKRLRSLLRHRRKRKKQRCLVDKENNDIIMKVKPIEAKLASRQPLITISQSS